MTKSKKSGSLSIAGGNIDTLAKLVATLSLVLICTILGIDVVLIQ